MGTHEPDSFLEQLKWRYAVKKFDPQKKIPAKTWQVLADALVLSPSSYGLQPWKFLVVQSPELRKELRKHSWNQSQVEDCSHYVVFAVHRKVDAAHIQKHIDRIAEVRGVAPATLDGFKKVMLEDVATGKRSHWAMEWAARQAYIALGGFMTAAAALGVDACPMEGIDPEKYDEVLGLTSGPYTTVVCCAAGFRHADDWLAKAKKVRFKADDVVEYL